MRSLFDSEPVMSPNSNTPLAARMRPRSLDEFIGQDHLLGPGKALRRAVETGRLGSVVLWGPPGTGKTSLALLLVGSLGVAHDNLSAVTSGVADLRKVVERARQERRGGRGLALIVDEIHRWNKAQQDALLPAVEEGLVTLIGLTTENPYFDLIPALRSRLRLLRLEPLGQDGVRAILRRSLDDQERGLGNRGITISDEAVELLVSTSGGDARTALNGLEAAADIAAQSGPEAVVTPEVIAEAIQRRAIRYDRTGDDHYQTISAFIKSIRGSDPDAAIFWLAKMLRAGEEPRFIARRLVVLASEDIGLALPTALVLAESAARAVEHVGMPEAGYVLAEATLYLATAPKSNSAASALWAAQEAIDKGASLEVPLHLRNASFAGARGLGYGTNYEYSHDLSPDDPARYQQSYLPDSLVGSIFFEPKALGAEAAIAAEVKRIRALRTHKPRTGKPPPTAPK
jgi:putative ATPase